MAAWNCAGGLLDTDGTPTDKVLDAHTYICNHNLHLLAISECELFNISHWTRNKKFTRRSIKDALNLPGYEVWFPQQWESYGLARIILLVKTELAVKELTSPATTDLPVILVEVGAVREPKI